jgi:hypothetical protein
MSLTITNSAGSLGDWLSLTPLLAARPNSTVIAQDSPHTRQFARLYEGLAHVEFTDQSVPPVLETDEPVCMSQRILNRYGVTGVSPIPTVILRDDEIQWARDFLAPYPNPVAFNNTTAAARADQPPEAMCNYRRLPDSLSRHIVAQLNAAGHTVLRFGCRTTMQNIYGGNYDEFAGVVNLPDLNVRQLAACYHVIGQYVGAATGDLHLALAVGAYVNVFAPPSEWHYDHARHHYRSRDFGSDPVRAQYNVFLAP